MDISEINLFFEEYAKAYLTFNAADNHLILDFDYVYSLVKNESWQILFA